MSEKEQIPVLKRKAEAQIQVLRLLSNAHDMTLTAKELRGVMGKNPYPQLTALYELGCVTSEKGVNRKPKTWTVTQIGIKALIKWLELNGGADA
jgi:hypothetical protein